MVRAVRFCTGCNAKHTVDETKGRCPDCRQELVPLAGVPTVDYIDVAATETQLGQAADIEQATQNLVGKRLAQYTIEQCIGQGGMARVYRAQHLMLDRPCALKVLSPNLVSRNPRYVEQFFVEARAAASLVHPHVVTVHNIGHEEQYYFIEMEYVHGRSLQRMVAREGYLDPARATRFILETASALAEAHRGGMVHRDFKPANILVSEDGVSKLADFGLAKTVIAEGGQGSQRALAGTPYYMAPELFEGQAASPRTDVYAVGVTYFYLLTGQLPYVAQKVKDLARKHAEQPMPDPAQLRPDLPAGAVAVLHRCLAKSPDARYADAVALHGDLRAVLGNLRDVQSLVREALSGLDLGWQLSDDRFVVTVPLKNQRSQRVFIQATAGVPVAQELVKVFSVCGPVIEGYFRRALELNAGIAHGSLAIQNHGGRPYFVMLDTYPRATCDPEEIRRSVLAIAHWADDVERALTGQDRH